MNRLSIAFTVILCCYLFATPALGLVFYDDATENTTAPTGVYADSGWQWVGDWSIASGVAISPKHFITAKHFSGYTTFTLGGVSYDYTSVISDPNSDLRIVEIEGMFPTWAPLYTSSDEVGREAVIVGRGLPRDGVVHIGGEDKGWYWATSGPHPLRWGTNVVTATNSFNGDYVGPVLTAEFDTDAGVNEAHTTGLDSGSGLFIKDGDDWKLAGINWLVDSYHTGNPNNQFTAAIYDVSKLYVSNYNNDSFYYNPPDWPGKFYATRISSQIDWINNLLPLMGDLNFDDNVDWYDYTTLRANFGLTGQMWDSGDMDGDGDVDWDDYSALRANYGATRGGGAGIPEPTTIVLLCLGATALFKRQRRASR